MYKQPRSQALTSCGGDPGRRIEIINNTRGGIEGEIWERGNGGQIEIPDEHHTILGLHQKKLKQESQNWVFYMFCMSLLRKFPKILNSND